MINWILTSSVLIILILAVRKFFGNRLTPGVQYGLWFLVLLRLLIPVSFFHSSYSAAELTGRAWSALGEAFSREPETYIVLEPESITEIDPGEFDGKWYPEGTVEAVEDHAYFPAESPEMSHGPSYMDSAVFYMIWLIGMGAAGGIFLSVNLFLRIRIYSDREEIVEEELKRRSLVSGVPVYVTKYVDTPCLAGLKAPAVYLPVSLWEQEEKEKTDRERTERELNAMICHENIHYRHGDQLWGFLRLLCLVVHWYNPLVWAAAFASKQDAELFCDEAVVKAIGEKNRFEYGRLLVRITAQSEKGAGKLLFPFRYAGFCNTEMVDTKKHIERRIHRLTKASKKNAAVIALAFLISLAAFGYLFIGGEAKESFLGEIITEDSAQEGEVDVKMVLPEERIADGSYFSAGDAAGGAGMAFYPSEAETEEVREAALRGMSEEEINALADYMKGYHNWLEAKLLYDNWEARLLDKESTAWNFIDGSGTVLAGWTLEWDWDPENYPETAEEERAYMKERYPEYGEISLEALSEKYGEPYYEENRYGAETVAERVNELTASAGNEVFRRDVEALCAALQQAKDTHEADYVMQAHEIVHDMEYFLLRYSPKEVAEYTRDKSLSTRYYGVLEVWKAWREGTL